MQTDNIYNVLNNYLKRSNRDSTNEVICRFMMNHLLEIPQMSVNEIADACFTSHPSIIRFTRELGFEGMADFKYNVQNYIDEVRSGEMRVSFPVEILSDEERFQQTLKAWLDVQSRIIVSSIQSDVREKTRRLCEEIQAHKKVVLFGAGLSEVVLELFRIELARCGKIVNTIGTQTEALQSYNREETLVIVLSMNGLFLSEATRNGKISGFRQSLTEHADRSWLITMNRNLKNTLTDEIIVINCSSSSFDFSLNTAIACFELIGECYQEMFAE